MKTGATIRSIRKRKRLTQLDLSEKTGLSQTYISLIETNNRTPSLDSLDSIGVALGVPSQIITFLSLEIEDVGVEKRELYKGLVPVFKAMITEFFLTDI